MQSQLGYDGAAYLSTAMPKPLTSVPRAMIGAVLINAAIGFTFLIAVLFCVQDLDTGLETPTDFPIIGIFSQVTQGSLPGATALTAAVILMALGVTIPLVTSVAS
ncbi:hypothetical protein BJX64DRAFT_284762 [Aspergillus heterothallicus]